MGLKRGRRNGRVGLKEKQSVGLLGYACGGGGKIVVAIAAGERIVI